MKTMYVYVLLCSDNSYYTGVTNNLELRFEQHKQGVEKACYPYKRRPLKIVFYELFDGPLKAIAFEKKIKGWSRAKKKALIENNWISLKDLSECKNITNSKVQMGTSATLSVTSQETIS
jgi:putative endonuclease